MKRNTFRKIRRAGILTAAGLCAVIALSAATFAAPDDAAARKIMEDVYKQDTSHDVTLKANFQIFDNKGFSSKKEFVLRRIGSPGDSKTLVVFTAPKEIKGVALLSINQQGTNDRQFVYTPATQRVRSVVAQERSTKFIGTDFTFEDIGERVLNDFNYILISDSETIDGHKCFKVEAVPVDPSKSQYKFVYYWIAKDVPVILHAELYDAQGREVRILHATDLKKANGIWGARHTEMRTVPDGTRTVFTIDDVKFNTKPDEKLFTPQGLADSVGPAPAK